jgi:hypothetical protein
VKKIFFISILLSISSLLTAQNFHAGLIGGLSTSFISGISNAGFNKIGLLGGGFVNYEVNEKTSLQSEIYYIEKGCHKNPNPNHNYYDTYRLNLQYLEVPVLFCFLSTSNIIFEVGPSVAWMIGHSEKDEYGTIVNAMPFKQNDIGIDLGLRIPFKKGFSFDFRLFNSVLPVRKHASGAHYRLNLGQYNSVIGFRLIYQFKHAKPEEN